MDFVGVCISGNGSVAMFIEVFLVIALLMACKVNTPKRIENPLKLPLTTTIKKL